MTTVQECLDRAREWNHLTCRSSARAEIHLSRSRTSGGSLTDSSSVSLIRGDVRVIVTDNLGDSLAWVYIFLKNPYLSKSRFMRCFRKGYGNDGEPDAR